MSGDFDFRIELYRLRVPIYKVASEIGFHLTCLSLCINGRLPMPSKVAERLLAIVKEHQRSE